MELNEILVNFNISVSMSNYRMYLKGLFCKLNLWKSILKYDLYRNGI